jgi:hypothetical protein
VGGEMAELIFTVTKKGESSVRVEGIKGGSCQQLTDGIEQELGGIVVEDEPTPEMFEREVVSERDQLRR